MKYVVYGGCFIKPAKPYGYGAARFSPFVRGFLWGWLCCAIVAAVLNRLVALL